MRHRFRVLSTLSLAAALLSSPLARAQETRNAFVWLEFTPPTTGDFSGWSTLQSVMDVSNEGRIVGQVSNGSGGTRGFVLTNDTWEMLHPTSANHTVRDVNNAGDVVGWKGTSTGMIWSIPYSSDGEVLSTSFKAESVNDSPDLVGYETTQMEPQAYLKGSGWYSLPGLSIGDPTAAHGISNGGAGDPVIVGTSKNGTSQAIYPVAWIWNQTNSEFDVVELDPGDAQDSDTPFVINDNGWIVGSTDSGTSPPYDYLLWTPDGSGNWDRSDLIRSGTSDKGIGLNASNEIVTGHYLIADDGSQLTEYDLYDMANIPVQGEATRYYVPSSTNFRAINDNGWIVGKATRKESGQTDVQVVLLLVPYDMNNNGTPDYREIITETPYVVDTNGDWVLDWATEMRVGFTAPDASATAASIDNALVIRVIRDHLSLYGAMYDQNQQSNCEGQSDDLTRWGYNTFESAQFSDRPKEIVVTIRTPWPDDTSEASDYVPPVDNAAQGEITKSQTLNTIECFAHRFARNIDYVQVGNEAWSGKGKFYIEAGQLPSPYDQFAGYLNDIPAAQQYDGLFDAALDFVFGWFGQEVEAVRRGSALAGRPLRVIGPVAGWGGIYEVLHSQGATMTPDEDPASSPARTGVYIQRLIQFCNAYDIPMDVHFYCWDYEEHIYSALDALMNQGVEGWDVPNAITSLEYTAIPSADPHDNTQWWNVEDETSHTKNSTWTQHFFDDEDDDLFPGITAWDSTSSESWQYHWLNDFTYKDAFFVMPADFPLTGFNDLASFGCRIACMPVHQNVGDPDEAKVYDMSAMYGDKLREETSPVYTRWRDAFENAADDFVITSYWDPHPAVCSRTPCPACEE